MVAALRKAGVKIEAKAPKGTGLLDRMLPSRLAGAFPKSVRVERVGLAEAVAQVRSFLTIPL